MLSLPDSVHEACSLAKKRAVFITWVKKGNKNDFRKQEVAGHEGWGVRRVKKGRKTLNLQSSAPISS